MKKPKSININKIPFGKLMIVLTLLLMVGLTMFYYIMKYKVMEDSHTHTINTVQSLAKQKDMMLTNTINNWYLYAETISEFCVGENDTYIIENIEKLEELKSPYVIAFDQNGNKISGREYNESISNYMYYDKVMAGERIVTDIFEEKSNDFDEDIVAVAVPMRASDGKVIGGIMCAYKISEIENILASEGITDFGETIVMDHNERIVVGSRKYGPDANFFDRPKEDKSYLDEEKVREIREGIEKKRSDFIHFGDGFRNGILVYEFNMTSEWTVVTTLDQIALDAYLYNITKSLLLTLQGSIISAAILYIIIFLLFLCIIYNTNKKSKVLKLEKDELTNLAMRDSMTGLYNKTTAINLIENFLNNEQGETKHALFFLDIDNFKAVNDKFGHEEGDKLIEVFAKLIKEHFRTEDIVARFGGDEFIILVKKYGSEQTLRQMSNRLCRLIVEKSQEKADYQFSTSIGIAIYPDHGTTCDDLMKNADKALYWSKKEGKNQYRIYENKKT